MDRLIENMSALELLAAVADIGIVSYIIYRTLVLIKGTRAVQMLVGILFLIFLFFLSKDENLDLPTLNWLLDKFIASFIIVIIVIFQEDIRRALTQVGKAPTVLPVGTESPKVFLDSLIRAVVHLSNHRIGAIIAVERMASLDNFTEGGVGLNARVSKDLLVSLFHVSHHNTLHDGAVMIQGGRISYAGCFLPLTVNPKVDRELGTRHRAAIGLSEETDSCVIVVSEETGMISIALHGELIRNFDEENLRLQLDGLLVEETRSTLWRRRQNKENK